MDVMRDRWNRRDVHARQMRHLRTNLDGGSHNGMGSADGCRFAEEARRERIRVRAVRDTWNPGWKIMKDHDSGGWADNAPRISIILCADQPSLHFRSRQCGQSGELRRIKRRKILELVLGDYLQVSYASLQNDRMQVLRCTVSSSCNRSVINQ